MLITVFGRRGTGKTTLLRKLIPVQKKPVIVLDVLGNFTDQDQWVITESYQDALLEIRAYIKSPKEHTGIIVVQDGDIGTALDFMCSALWKIGGGTLVLDEVDAFSTADSPCFDEAIRYGRNRGIDVLTGCRRPAEISKNITAGADITFIFNTHEPRDIDYYREFLADSELAEKLPSIPEYHGVFKDFKSNKSGIFKTDVDGTIHLLKQSQTIKDKPKKNSKNKKQQNIEHENPQEIEAAEIQETPPSETAH